MSYQNLNALVEEIRSELLKLENSELSLADVDAIQTNARELYDRLTVLKYLAMERLADEPEPEPNIDKDQGDDSVDVDMAPIKLKLGNAEKNIPENQTSLLDAIEESDVEKKPDESMSENLNQKLAVPSESKSIADKLKSQPISDLVAAIGINQKFLFMNDLFKGERDEFHHSMGELNKFDSFLDADNYIRNNLMAKYSWDMESPSAIRFMELIERRYLS
jgi:hypothetical protein